MAAYAYVATIKLATGKYQKVRIQADTIEKAKSMLEAQYGRGSVSNIQRA